MSRLHTTQQMALRKLTRQVLAKMRHSSVHKVLVTSALPGEGKSLFVKTLALGLEKAGYENRPRIIPAEKLAVFDPANTGGLVLVDGPAFFGDSGFEKIPDAWMEAFDSAVVLLVARSSRRAEVIELLDWLRQYEIREIWPVWNEKLTPPPKSLLARVRYGLGLDEEKMPRNEDRRFEQRPFSVGAGLEHSPHKDTRSPEPAFVTQRGDYGGKEKSRDEL